MDSIENTFSDKEGNHLLVALYFFDREYKRDSLNIPEEYTDIDILDINITKAFVDKPIHFSVFLKMCGWILEEFRNRPDAVFTFICSTDDLDTNHPTLLPQQFRWNLFDTLYKRYARQLQINIQDVVVGPDGYQSMGRAFYRNLHAPIIHLITSYLQEKQQ